MFPTAIHVAVAHGDRQGADPGPGAASATCWPTRPRQWDKIIKIGRTHLADATPIRLGQEFSGFARQLELSIERAQRAHAGRAANCPPAARPSAPASTRIPQFGAKVAEVLAKETGIAVRRGREPLRGQRQPRRPGRMPAASLRTIAVDAVHRRQQHPLARQRPALRLLRSHAARPPARLVDHARQGQPGDVREHDAGLRPRDRQRPDASPSPARPAASSSSTS